MKPTHTWGDAALAVATTTFVALAAFSGLLFQALSAVVVLALYVGLLSRVAGFVRKDLELGLLRRPLSPHLFWYRIQLAVRLAFLLAWALTARATIALLPMLGAGLDRAAWTIVAVIAVLSLALWIVPRKRIALSSNLAFAIGTLALAILLIRPLLPLSRGAVVLDLPLHERR